jgi:hypothetical protein
MKTAALVEPERPLADSRPEDERWELVRRVAASSPFKRSKRLCELLSYVCDHALKDPGGPLREHEIGRAVFGRPAEFDPSQDTLVRVQASQLRKRLQQYFSVEGAGEPVVIELPTGGDLPAFRPRAELSPPVPASDATVPPPAVGRRTYLLLAAALGLALVACGLLAYQNRQLTRRMRAGFEHGPAVDRLWRQMFGNGRHTYLVLADANVTIFQDLIHQQISPTEYQRQRFGALADQHLTDPARKDFARRLMNRQFTSLADAGLARRIGLLNAHHGVPTDIVLARQADPGQFKSHNAVLSGSRRSNPWVGLFEDRLNFRTRFDEEDRRAYIDNMTPRPGEQATYRVQWDRLGYCRVAYLPNLDRTGTILLLSGTDMASSEAGTEFITSERWVERLRSELGLSSRAPFPYFEALLRTQLVIGAAPSFDLVAWRKLDP